MNKQITKEMVILLNQELYEKGYCFSYKLETVLHLGTQIHICLPNVKGLTSYIININDEFYNWLTYWFKVKYDIKLTCNNDRSILWAIN
nr:MAG TPA: hypothetical protein [Caudoviricetes sp.]